MKKHVSLFLALLMVVSMFFAFPAEAEALEQTRMEQPQIHEYGHVPSVTNLYDAKTTSTGAAGTGNNVNVFNGCVHTFRLVQYNSSQHKKVCTKCGYSNLASHSFGYTQCGNVHNKRCSCGYSVNEAHTYVVGASKSSTLHKITCSKCKIESTASHSFTYTQCGNVHNKHCSCGYSVNESHTYGAAVPTSETTHKQTCACGQTIQGNHNWTTPSCYNSDYHARRCTVCSCIELSEHHTYLAVKPYRVNGVLYPGTRCCTQCEFRTPALS